jgi:hypothetical protein
MPKKYSYKLWDSSPETAECWHCDQPTLYFLTNVKTGESRFCCPVCAVKIYKLKKIVARLRNYSQKRKSLKIKPILHIKNPLFCNVVEESE